jgi:hypothetical protein
MARKATAAIAASQVVGERQDKDRSIAVCVIAPAIAPIGGGLRTSAETAPGRPIREGT